MMFLNIGVLQTECVAEDAKAACHKKETLILCWTATQCDFVSEIRDHGQK